MKLHVLSRKWHKHVAILVAVPFLVILVTGIPLQLRKQLPWVQPPTRTGSGTVPAVSFDAILTAVKAVPETEVQSWAEITRADVRPKDGVVKVQCKNRYEVQVDLGTGAVLQTEYRRNDWLVSIHEGEAFGDWVKYYVFLPVAVLLLTVWFTGVHLWVLPKWVKARRPRKLNENTPPA